MLEIASEVDVYSMADPDLPLQVREDIACEYVDMHEIPVNYEFVRMS